MLLAAKLVSNESYDARTVSLPARPLFFLLLTAGVRNEVDYHRVIDEVLPVR